MRGDGGQRRGGVEARMQQHPRAGLGHFQGETPAEAARRAGDDDTFAGECGHVVVLSWWVRIHSHIFFQFGAIARHSVCE